MRATCEAVSNLERKRERERERERGGEGERARYACNTYFTRRIAYHTGDTIFPPSFRPRQSVPGEVLRRGAGVPGFRRGRRNRRHVRLRSQMRAEASTDLCEQRQGVRQSLRAPPRVLQRRHVLDHTKALQMPGEQW